MAENPPTERLNGLFAEERQRAILEQLRRQGKVTVEELARAFGVSSPTIRADLSRLETRNLLRRTHGGAIALENTLYEPTYAERAILHQAEKQAIARVAVQCVNEGETVLLDAGTTCHEIALGLTAFRRLTVVTNSLISAQALSEKEGIEVVLLGGVLQHRRWATLGPLAVQFLEPFRCDCAFVAMSGVHPTAGFTVVDFDAAHLKRKMLEKGKRAVVVADSSKIGQVAFACVGPVTADYLLLTDSGLLPEDRLALEATGLRIEIASPTDRHPY